MTNALCLYQKPLVDQAEATLIEQGLPAPVCRLVSSYFADCAMLSEVLEDKTPPERVVVWLKGLGIIPGVTVHCSINDFGWAPRWSRHNYRKISHEVLLFVVRANFSSAFNDTLAALNLERRGDLDWPTKTPKEFTSTCCFHYLTCLHFRNELQPEISNERQAEIDKLKQQDPVLRANLEKIVRSWIQKPRHGDL